jgi:hypothetical protein
MKKKLKDEVLVETFVERYDRFLNSRKGDGGKYVNEIIEFLVYKFNKVPGGWVRPRELKQKTSCVDQTLFRLLDGLKSEHIIERQGKDRTQRERPGQDPVYYRISPLIRGSILTEAGRKKELSRLSKDNIDLTFDLFDALSVLKRHNLISEYEQEREITRKTGREGEQFKSASLQQTQ